MLLPKSHLCTLHCNIKTTTVLMSHRCDITLLREVALTISLYLLKWLQGPSSQWSRSYLYWCTWCYSTYSIKIVLRGLLRVWNYSLLPMLWQACQLKEHMTLANYSPTAVSQYSEWMTATGFPTFSPLHSIKTEPEDHTASCSIAWLYTPTYHDTVLN